jgi:hypothetical protein
MPCTRPLSIFGLIALIALAACATPASQNEVAPYQAPGATIAASGTATMSGRGAAHVSAYIAPAPGTRLNEFFTVRELEDNPDCLVYVHNEGGRFFIRGGGVNGFETFHPGTDRAVVVLEKQPGGNACPTKAPVPNVSLVKLRAPIKDNGAFYTLELPSRTCDGGKGQPYQCRWFISPTR